MVRGKDDLSPLSEASLIAISDGARQTPAPASNSPRSPLSLSLSLVLGAGRSQALS